MKTLKHEQNKIAHNSITFSSADVLNFAREQYRFHHIVKFDLMDQNQPDNNEPRQTFHQTSFRCIVWPNFPATFVYTNAGIKY